MCSPFIPPQPHSEHNCCSKLDPAELLQTLLRVYLLQIHLNFHDSIQKTKLGLLRLQTSRFITTRSIMFAKDSAL